MYRLFLATVLTAVMAAIASAADPADSLLIVSTRTGRPQVFLTAPETGDCKNLTCSKSADLLPAWSPDGKCVAFTSDRDGTPNIYVIEADGSRLRQITHEKLGSLCFSPSWSPDGQRIAFGRRTGDSAYLVVANADGSEPRTIAGDAGCPAWSPDGSRLAVMAGRPGVGWRLALLNPDGTGLQELTDHDNPHGNMYPAWSADGREIAFADAVGSSVELFLIRADGSARRQLTHLGGRNMYPAWAPDGKEITFAHIETPGSGFYAVIGAEGTRLRLAPGLQGELPNWDFRPAWRPGVAPAAGRKRIIAIGIHPATHEEARRTVRIEGIHRLRGHQGPVLKVAFSPDGDRLLTGGDDGLATIWDWRTGKPEGDRPLRGHQAGILSIAWSPDGRTVATGSRDRTARIWDVGTKSSRATLDDFADFAHGIAYSADGKYLVTASYDRVIKVRDASSLEILKTLRFPDDISQSTAALAFSPDGKSIVAGGGRWESPGDGFVICWDAAGGEQRWKTLAIGGAWALAFTQDGKNLAAACLDGKVRVLDRHTGEVGVTLSGHSDRVIGVAWSPDGKRLASTAYDHTVRLWDRVSGEELARLSGHMAPCTGVDFARDGKVLATSSLDGTVNVWRIEE